MHVLQFLKSEDAVHSAWAKKIITWMKKKKIKKTNHRIYCVSMTHLFMVVFTAHT